MELEVGTPKGPSSKKSKAPASSGGLTVEAPSERVARRAEAPVGLGGAVDPNPLRDRDRVFGRKAVEAGGPEGYLRHLVDSFRSTHNRQGTSYAPDFEVLPGSAVSLEGAAALAHLESLGALEDRGAGYLAGDSLVTAARDDAYQSIQRSEEAGRLNPEAAQRERDLVRENYERELAVLEGALRRADAANRVFAESASGGRSGGNLAVAGEAAFGRAAMMDVLVEEHSSRAIRERRDPEDPARLEMEARERQRFQDDLDALLGDPGIVELGEAQRMLSESREFADGQSELLANDVESAIQHHPESPEAQDLLNAARHYMDAARMEARVATALRKDQEDGLVHGRAVRDATTQVVTFLNPVEQAHHLGRMQALKRVERGDLDGNSFYVVLRGVAQQRRAEVEGLQDPENDHANPALVSKIQDAHSRSEACETELVLARQQKDEAALRMLLAARRFYDSAGEPEKSEKINPAIQGLLRWRAQGTDLRTLDSERLQAMVSYKQEAVEFVDANISMIEVPDRLPDIEMLRVKASAASRNMGFMEAWKTLKGIEARDMHEAVQKGGAYLSIMRDSLAFRMGAGVVHYGKGTAEHVAAGMYALLHSAAEISLHQGTQLSRSIATGQDAGQGIQMALSAVSASADSFAKAWAMLTLAKSLREAQKRNRMERDNQLRARLENREREIQRVVQNRKDGLEAVASYMDGASRFKESVRKVVTAEAPEREARRQEALLLLGQMENTLKSTALDHSQNHKFLAGHPELSPEALRRNAAESLVRFGLASEAASFDEQIAHRALKDGRFGKANVYQAVDAWKSLLAITQKEPDRERPVPQAHLALKDLPDHKHYGNHGALAPGLFVVNTKEGPAGVMFNCNQPPGVAIIPLKTDEVGQFTGFEQEPKVFDLLDIGGDEALKALTVDHDPRYHADILNGQWHRFADECGLGPIQSEAIRGYLQAAQLGGGLPFQTTSPESLRQFANLRNAGVLIPPTSPLDEARILPVSEGAKLYWAHYGGAMTSTEKLRAGVEAVAQSAMDNSVASQTFVQAARGRLARYRLAQAEGREDNRNDEAMTES